MSEQVSLPTHLRGTGLYEGGTGTRLCPDILSFTPRYPLWTDGAGQRRWLYLPPGQAIDASRPDAWVFPPGTRLWKEFTFGGRPVETRYIERRMDGSWRFTAYVWSEDDIDAHLAPERGIAELPVVTAPGGRHAIPSRAECLSCHEATEAPVLGASALQLSPDRDPLAPHVATGAGDVDLEVLGARGLLRALPEAMRSQPPRIAARSARERAALGYLHGNCGHCHNQGASRVPVRLTLAQAAMPGASEVMASVVRAASHYRPPGAANDGGVSRVVVPGQPGASVLALRMRSRHPLVRMPPLGTQVPDPEGLALIESWITHDLLQLEENLP
jgi:hypothetical protein